MIAWLIYTSAKPNILNYIGTMSIHINIRPAEVSDALAIAVIHIRTSQVAYRGIMPASYLETIDLNQRAQGWHDALSRSTKNTIVAEIDEKVIGFVDFGPCRDEDLPQTLEIRAIYVHPDYWRNGVGRQLMEAAEAQIVAQRCPVTIALWVLDENKPGRHFYEQHGYVADGRQEEIGKLEKTLCKLRYQKVISDD